MFTMINDDKLCGFWRFEKITYRNGRPRLDKGHPERIGFVLTNITFDYIVRWDWVLNNQGNSEDGRYFRSSFVLDTKTYQKENHQYLRIVTENSIYTLRRLSKCEETALDSKLSAWQKKNTSDKYAVAITGFMDKRLVEIFIEQSVYSINNYISLIIDDGRISLDFKTDDFLRIISSDECKGTYSLLAYTGFVLSDRVKTEVIVAIRADADDSVWLVFLWELGGARYSLRVRRDLCRRILD
jgi:hypothetical protein